MAITYVGAGAVVYSTTNPSPAAPTHAVGDLLIAIVGTKPDTTPATAPSGWTSIGSVAGGGGTTGIDTGPMRFGVFTKIATSTTDTTGAITVTGNSVSSAQVLAYRAGAGNVLDAAFTGAADTTANATFTAAMPINPGLTVGDEIIGIGIIPTDSWTGATTIGSQWSAQSVSATGMTTVTLTEIAEYSSSAGQDMGGWVARGAVVTGTASGVPTITSTAAGTAFTNITGVLGMVRLREIPALATINVTDTGTLSATDTSGITAEVSMAATDTGTFSATELAATFAVFDSKSATDTGSISATDSSSVVKTNITDYAQVAYGFYSESSLATSLLVSSGARLNIGDIVVFVGFAPDTSSGEWSVPSNTSANLDPFNVLDVGFQAIVALSIVTAPGAVSFTADYPESTELVGFTAVVRNADYGEFAQMRGTLSKTAATAQYTANTGYPNSTELVFSNDGGISGVVTTNSGTLSNVDFYQTSSNRLLSMEKTANPRPVQGSSYTNTLVGGSGTKQLFGVELFAIAPGGTFAQNRTDSGTISATETSDVVPSGGAGDTPISGSDTGTLSATDTATVLVISGRTDTGTISATDTSVNASTLTTRTDSGTFSATDASSNLVSVTRTDTGTFSATDTSVNLGILSRTDTGTLSATDASTNASTLSTTDAGTFAATDTSSVSPSDTPPVDVPGTDTGSLSAIESASVVVILTVTDSGTFSGTDASSNASALSRVDTGSFSATDSSASALATATSDTGTLSAADSSASQSALARTDSGTFSATDASANVSTLARTDTGTFSATDTAVVVVIVSRTDTGTFSATDTSTNASTLARADTGTLSGSELALVFNDRPGVDSGILSATETASVGISGTVSKSGTDTGTLSATDTASVKVVVDSTDTGTLSATDTSSIGESAPVVAGVDSGILSATESSSVVKTEGFPLEVFSGSVMIEGNLVIWNGANYLTPEVYAWDGSQMNEL